MDDKNKKNTTIIIIIIAILVLFGCLLVSCCAGSLYVFMKSNPEDVSDTLFPKDNEIQNQPTEQPVEATQQPEDDTEKEETDTEGKTNSALTQQQEKIIKRAEKLRGLSGEPLAPTYKTKDELRDFMTKDLYDDTSETEFEDERDLLSLLAFVPKDFDLEAFYLDMYTEQIAGFYDQDTNEMVLVDGGSEIQNSLTLAHEYTHYLQFNNFDMDGELRYNDKACEEDPEHCLVMSALTEGDATLLESLLRNESDLGLKNLYDTNTDDGSTSFYDTMPKYFQENLYFPYDYGFDFVYSYYLRGGYTQVDKLYQTPPESIEQIMHPQKYLKDKPVTVDIAPFVKQIEKKCQLGYENVLNEADILFALSAAYDEGWRLSEKEAKTASEGWGGGEFQFARYEGQGIFFGKTVWDTEKDAEEFNKFLTKYANLRWDNTDETGVFEKDGQRCNIIQQNDLVFWIISPENYDISELTDMINQGSAL